MGKQPWYKLRIRFQFSPSRGGRLVDPDFATQTLEFQFSPSRGGRLRQAQRVILTSLISILALAWRASHSQRPGEPGGRGYFNSRPRVEGVFRRPAV